MVTSTTEVRMAIRSILMTIQYRNMKVTSSIILIISFMKMCQLWLRFRGQMKKLRDKHWILCYKTKLSGCSGWIALFTYYSYKDWIPSGTWQGLFIIYFTFSSLTVPLREIDNLSPVNVLIQSPQLMKHRSTSLDVYKGINKMSTNMSRERNRL